MNVRLGLVALVGVAAIGVGAIAIVDPRIFSGTDKGVLSVSTSITTGGGGTANVFLSPTGNDHGPSCKRYAAPVTYGAARATDGGAGCETLDTAITKASASDTIEMEPGTYSADVSISRTKTVTINAAGATIYGTDTGSGTVFTAGGGGYTINGLTVLHMPAGVACNAAYYQDGGFDCGDSGAAATRSAPCLFQCSAPTAHSTSERPRHPAVDPLRRLPPHLERRRHRRRRHRPGATRLRRHAPRRHPRNLQHHRARPLARPGRRGHRHPPCRGILKRDAHPVTLRLALRPRPHHQRQYLRAALRQLGHPLHRRPVQLSRLRPRPLQHLRRPERLLRHHQRPMPTSASER